jgi:hypothetical protein
MHAPPKSRGPSGPHAFLHIAQPGVPFITVGAKTFGGHTSGGLRIIGPFASQNFSPSPQPQAEKGLTDAREIHSTLGFCVTTPATARRPVAAPSAAFPRFAQAHGRLTVLGELLLHKRFFRVSDLEGKKGTKGLLGSVLV